ncbi:unnamed protein product [Staurois parvus]|uniref:Uncharacterized protein n=1 Tax=Staurois parvus TaxID=386267 RepID=A0ABN9DRN7_9NEOB|nr:unnamed protein product [Staurois parvus]
MYSHHIRCAHQSAPLHQISPSECPFTSGIPITLSPYIRYSRQIPLSIIFPHQSAPLHHIPHQSAPFHHMCPSECPFPQYMPICAPLNIKWACQSAP